MNPVIHRAIPSSTEMSFKLLFHDGDGLADPAILLPKFPDENSLYLLTLAAPLVQHLEHQFLCNQSSKVWLEGGEISVSQSLSGRAGLGRVSLLVPTTRGPESEGGWAGGLGVQGASSSLELALLPPSSSTRSVSLHVLFASPCLPLPACFLCPRLPAFVLHEE